MFYFCLVIVNESVRKAAVNSNFQKNQRNLLWAIIHRLSDVSESELNDNVSINTKITRNSVIGFHSERDIINFLKKICKIQANQAALNAIITGVLAPSLSCIDQGHFSEKYVTREIERRLVKCSNDNMNKKKKKKKKKKKEKIVCTTISLPKKHKNETNSSNIDAFIKTLNPSEKILLILLMIQVHNGLAIQVNAFRKYVFDDIKNKIPQVILQLENDHYIWNDNDEYKWIGKITKVNIRSIGCNITKLLILSLGANPDFMKSSFTIKSAKEAAKNSVDLSLKSLLYKMEQHEFIHILKGYINFKQLAFNLDTITDKLKEFDTKQNNNDKNNTKSKPSELQNTKAMEDKETLIEKLQVNFMIEKSKIKDEKDKIVNYHDRLEQLEIEYLLQKSEFEYQIKHENHNINCNNNDTNNSNNKVHDNDNNSNSRRMSVNSAFTIMNINDNKIYDANKFDFVDIASKSTTPDSSSLPKLEQESPKVKKRTRIKVEQEQEESQMINVNDKYEDDSDIEILWVVQPPHKRRKL
eukprot:232950_1